ncbi:hypothetical protein GCM10009654_24010 [Streptomyces hebeiensis]|uniref:DUF397 domain-containing protein n=1 Tax=Streptomyces hebeiensis TaxID=229486 RepID=A0ABN1UUT5_9ACTN
MRVPHAGPDGSKTLPDGAAARQFPVAWESSHSVCGKGFEEKARGTAPPG